MPVIPTVQFCGQDLAHGRKRDIVLLTVLSLARRQGAKSLASEHAECPRPLCSRHWRMRIRPASRCDNRFTGRVAHALRLQDFASMFCRLVTRVAQARFRQPHAPPAESRFLLLLLIQRRGLYSFPLKV